jgi:antitoxin ParD1/3/4
MQISLTAEQREWLEAKVAAGQFDSIEEAAAAAIADSMAGEIDDMAWAKPYVDEARDAVARGDVLTIEEHRARIARHLSKT